MKSEKIFEALRNVDEKLLERSERETVAAGARADRAGSRRRFPKAARTGAAAACLCLICAGLLWTGVWPGQDSAPPPAEFAQLEGAMDGDAAAAREGLPETAPGEASEEAVGGAGDGDKEAVSGAGEAGKEAVSGAGEEAGKGAGEAAEPESGMSRPPADGDDEKLMNTAENTTESLQQAAKEDLLNNKGDMAVDTAAPLELTAYASLQELLADEEFGSYVPQTVPERYVFESASKYKSDGRNVLSVVWSCGPDTIWLSVDRKPNQPAAVTDVSKPETYNVNLYEIPYCDSVPQEYRESLFNPVFRREELDLEVVKARTRIISDRGDTSTPRADFGVLYEDGTLVNITARGTAEEIYALFSD